MAANYTITTRNAGDILTAAIYNADHQNHIDNGVPLILDDYSANLAQMQTTTDPGELAGEDLATSLAGELARLRFAIQDIKAFYDTTLTRWYQTPTRLSLALGTQTASVPVLNGTVTWNSAGTTFTALKVAVTSTASAAASLLLDLTVGGTSQLTVSKAGVVTALGSLIAPTIGPNSAQVHTLPAVASDTVALIGASQTLTSKTLTAPTVGTSLTLSDATTVILGSSTGTKIGTATTQKLAFYNSTPVVQPSAYTQTYATADKTHANATSATLTDSTGGSADTTVADVTASHSQTILNNNFADLTAQVNALRVDLLDAKQLLNSVIDDLQALGLAG